MLTIPSRASSRTDAAFRLGKALADPNRSRILLSLLDSPGYPAELARSLDLSRTNVSNHLSCLKGCGLISAIPEGRSTRYEISDPHLARALSLLLDVALTVDEGEQCSDPSCLDTSCCAVPA